MFPGRKLNNRINNIHERTLRIVYRDYESTFQQLLKQNKFVSIHQTNLQILATEIFKTKNSLNPVSMEDVFNFKELAYNFQNVETLNRSNVTSVKYGTEKITSLGAKIWEILLNDYKELASLSTFILIIYHCYYVFILLLLIYLFNWYKLDCKFFAELCKFFQFQIKC